MAIERVDSLFDIPAIQQEFSAVKTGLADSQKALVDLYSQVKGFKDTNITTLASNTQKLMDSINGSTQATARAAQNYDALTKKIAEQVAASRSNTDAIAGQAQAYDQLIKQSVRNKLGLDELAKSAKEVKAAFDKGETTLDQYTASLESIKGAQQTLKISNQDITKGLNNLEKQAQSSGTSVDGLKAKLNLLTQAYDKLSEEERASEGGQALLKNLNDTDTAYKKLKESTGRYQDSVGNYSGAFQEAFKVLKDQLSQVNKEMSSLEEKGKTTVQNLTGGNTLGFDPNRYKGSVTSFTKAGGESVNIAAADAPVYQKAAQQQELLSKLVTSTGAGFRSTRQEMRAFQEAAVELGLAVGQDDEKFLLFNEAVGETKNAIQDIKSATAFQAQDAKVIVGLTSAVNGLVGAFGAAQAAVALTGDQTEETQKQMAKFQELLVLINGLQQVSNTLQVESGAIQLALAAKIGLVNAAKKIQMLMTTQAIAAVTVETTANEANAVSQESVAAGAGEAAVAMEAEAVAATEGAVATTAFSTAFIATGIGAVILAVGAAIVYLVSKIPGWIQGSHLTIQQQKDLADAMKTANDVIIAQADIIKELDAVTKRYYENQLTLAAASGQNEYKQFALKKQIAQEEKKLAQDQVDILGASNKSQVDQAASLQQLNEEKKLAIEIEEKMLSIFKKDQTNDNKDQLEAAKTNVEIIDKKIAGTESLYNAGRKARADLFAANLKADELDLQEAKFSADEQRRLVLETAKLDVEAQKDKNSKILSDQASTLQERLVAIKSNSQQEKKAAQAEFKNVEGDPSTTPTQLLEARKKRNAAFAQADRDAAKETNDTNRTFYEKDRDARLEIYKQSIQDSLRFDQDVLSKKIGHGENDTTGDAKLNALKSQLNLQQSLAEQNRQEDLDAEGLTNEQKLAINKKYNSEIENLQLDFLKSQRELEKEIRDATLADWDQYYEERKTQLDKETNAEIAALNERLLKRKISQQKYDDELKLVNDRNALDSINLEVMNDYIKVQAYKDGTKEKADAEKKLTADLKTQNQAQTQGELDKTAIARAQVERTFQDVQSQSQNYAQAIVDAINIGYNTQKVHLEELEARQQKAYEQDVKNINDTSSTEEQKAIRLKILDSQRAVQKEQNDRKQRQLDIQKAQFDKAKDILGIITGTALAVVKALPNVPLAVSVGILGAAELAAAIATPLPHYKEGTLNHPGGAAVTGDGGVKELILEPGRPARWSQDRPTLEKLMPHTKVIPPHKIDEWLMAGMFVNPQGALVEMKQPDIKQELRDIKDAIVWAAQEQREVAKANRPRIVNKITVNAGWNTYVQNSVFK
jgi:hypothetical protein